MSKYEEYDYIYDEEIDEDDVDEEEYFEELVWDEEYEDIYDQDGDSVFCPFCLDIEIKLRNDEYVCPMCNYTMDLETFLNYIGYDEPI